MARHYSAAISTLFGKFASREFSPKVQAFINKSYVKLMKLDMSQFEEPESYASLNALFTRSFKFTPKRPLEQGQIISPCDALVTEVGQIHEAMAMQIKGMSYDLAALLSGRYAEDIALLEGGAYINLYLSPRDYHRYHMPFDLEVLSILHIPGKLYPVDMPLLRNKLNLFIENERVVIECRDSSGAKHYLVLVGALNVGKMVVTFEERIQTNAKAKSRSYYAYEEPVKLQIGELFGWFEMGSTILMFSQSARVSYGVPVGKKVSFGEPIGSFLGT
jgi:phosphatidylserine decarboxylase